MYIKYRSEKSNVINILLEAASDIEDYGWNPRGADHENEYDPFGTYARCPWVAVIRVIERISAMHPGENTGTLLARAEDALVAVAHVKDIIALFDLNDSIPEEQGKQWAINLLKNAADFVSGVPVSDLVTEEMAIVSTKPMESGNTTNAVNPAKRLLNWWHNR